jgi:HD-GYP domain-containing protein (c-di-GMP phosphodiesterase class II)
MNKVRRIIMLRYPVAKAADRPTTGNSGASMDVHRSDRTGKPHVAVVMGSAAQRARVSSTLASLYRLVEYSDLSRAMAGLRACAPRLALVGEELAAGSGFDLVRVLRLDPSLTALPVVMVVAADNEATLEKVVQCGANGHLACPYSRSALIATVSGLLNRRVEGGWQTLSPLQRQALTGTLELFNGIADGIGDGEPIRYQAVSDACEPLVEAVANDEFRGILNGVRDHDNYTFAHSMRIATFLALFGFNIGLSKNEQIILASGGLLHDVGKTAIPFEVLNKPGRLDPAEFAVMKGHVTATVGYLKGFADLPKGVITIAAQHHERLDGSGYPLGLAGNQLDRLARIASIIDVFGALTDRRIYKEGMGAEAALNFIMNEMGAQLDLKLLGLFRQMLLDATREVRPERRLISSASEARIPAIVGGAV